MVPEGTVNCCVAAQLAELSAMHQAFTAAGRQSSESESANGESKQAAKPEAGKIALRRH
jgi:hypothetical protein